MILTCPVCSTRYEADGSEFPPEGRKVRCSKCGQIWHYTPPPDPDAGIFSEEPPSPPEPEFVPEVPPEPEPPPFEVEAEPEIEREPDPEPESVPPPAPADADEMPFRRRFLQSAADDEGETEPFCAPPAYKVSAGTKFAVGIGWLALVGIVLTIGWAALAYRQTVMDTWPQSASLYSVFGYAPKTGSLKIEDYQLRQTVEDGLPVLVVAGKLVNRGSEEIPVPRIRAALLSEGRRELYGWTFSPPASTLKPGQSTRFTSRLSSPPAAARHLELRLAKAGE
jgi:predicted Zn finger-like uncharacterized protein